MSTVLICGSRFVDWPDAIKVKRVLVTLPLDTVIIHGAAPGIDTYAGRFGYQFGMAVRAFPAHWLHTKNCPPDCKRETGKRAGSLRNQQMLDEGKPDRVIAFPRPSSIGTYDMIRRAKAASIPVEVIEIGIRREVLDTRSQLEGMP